MLRTHRLLHDTSISGHRDVGRPERENATEYRDATRIRSPRDLVQATPGNREDTCTTRLVYRGEWQIRPVPGDENKRVGSSVGGRPLTLF